MFSLLIRHRDVFTYLDSKCNVNTLFNFFIYKWATTLRGVPFLFHTGSLTKWYEVLHTFWNFWGLSDWYWLMCCSKDHTSRDHDIIKTWEPRDRDWTKTKTKFSSCLRRSQFWNNMKLKSKKQFTLSQRWLWTGPLPLNIIKLWFLTLTIII